MAAEAARPDWRRQAGLFAGLGVVAYATNSATRGGDLLATFWPYNGLLLAVILAAPARRLGPLLLAGWLTNFLANLAGGLGAHALAPSFYNVVEVGVAAAGIRRTIRSPFDLADLRQLASFTLFGVIIGPLVAAGLAGLGVPFPIGDAAWPAAMHWFVGDALGMALAVPVAWALGTRRGRATLTRRRLGELALLLPLTALATAYTFITGRAGLPFLLTPLLVLVTFRTGFVGAAVTLVVVGMIAIGATAAGYGPTMLLPGLTTGDRLMVAQAWLGTILMTVLPLAVVLDERWTLGATQHRILELVESATGGEFLDSLTAHLTRICDVDFAMVGLQEPEAPHWVHGVSVARQGARVEPFSYDTRGTPCEQVGDRSVCHYATGVRELFPADRLAVEYGVDSCMGIALFGRDGRRLGLLILFHTRPIPDPARAETILRVVAARVGSELERRAAEEALRASEARLRAILESSLDGLIVTAADGSIVEFNAAAEAMFRTERNAMIGRPVAELIMVDRTGERVETVARRADGTSFHADVAFATIPGAMPPMRAGVIRDITASRALEEQLRQSQKMQAVGQLAGGIAHDFNNLLTVVTGTSDLLLTGPAAGNAELVELVTAIRNAGRRAADLTRQLLLFSRQAPLESRPLDLNAVIDGTVKLIRPLLGEDIELVVTHGTGLPQVRGDAGQLGQVVMNLAINARHAMPGGGRLALATAAVTLGPADLAGRRDITPGLFAHLRVTDNGVGMSPDVLAHLFEPFYTTKGPDQGTGLGLATVHGIVTRAGGFVTAASVEGAGSTFDVYLPGIPDQPAPAEPPAAAGVAAVGRGRTVLLVEDETSVRDVARRSLVRAGFLVVEAGGGAEALERLAGHAGPIALLLTDLVMPGMSGYELAEAARRIRPDLAVLFMSGYEGRTRPGDGPMGARGAFLAKPFLPAALVARVREVLDG